MVWNRGVVSESARSFSLMDLFTVGIGPSSSHTVGPMRAAAEFVEELDGVEFAGVRCDLYGSLADTGKGHGTGKALILGFMGHRAGTVDVDAIEEMLEEVKKSGSLILGNGKRVDFDEREGLVYHRGKVVGVYSNAMHFTALGDDGEPVKDQLYYSVGGGFILKDGEVKVESQGKDWVNQFDSAEELMKLCEEKGCSISDLVLENEAVYRSEEETRGMIDEVWEAMESCIARGIEREGILPGGLKVKRRAKKFHESLVSGEAIGGDHLGAMDWVNLYALAVNEENAAGGRVVTAPTNGAAGIIPAVLKYAVEFCQSPFEDGIHRFFLAAGAIGSLYKKNASISGADVGCQGEVGVACSMAAAGLTEFLGGTPEQVEFAAEIGMEHNLGLTCDPIGGLVQIPCIERNAMGSVKAINASRLARRSCGDHHVSLDRVIEVMKATGRDMDSKYKETARGGLAVNVVEC